MSYNINFSDQINNGALIVNDNSINTSTSLGFPGRNQKGYAVTISENFLHLLENFANTTAPLNPIKGQLWYDSTEGSQTLMIYDGTSWKSAGALKKGSTQPDVSTSILGDLWVDTTNQQLYLYNGGGWVLVGPTFSSSNGRKTGAIAVPINDSTKDRIEHIVLMNYVDDTVVSITSTTAFTPQIGIPGFTTINVGLNLSNLSNKFWGTSEKAENLVIGNTVIPASTFLRSDTANIANQALTIKNNSGLSLGGESQLQLRITDSKGIIYHSTPASKLDFRVNVGSPTSTETTLISLDATTGNVGIGRNNFNPTESLSVIGTGSFTGSLKITNADDVVSLSSSIGSFVVSGGAKISKSLIVGSGITVQDNLLPTINNHSNIGSSLLRFANVYATSLIGNLTGNVIGNVTGNVNGNVNGSSSRLISSTTFTITGDVSDPVGFSFDGSSQIYSAGSFTIGNRYKIVTPGNTDFRLIGAASNTVGLIFTATGVGTGTGTATAVNIQTFNTTISPTFITTKTELSDTQDTDELLVYRPYTPGGLIPGLYKSSKSTFISDLPLVPIGAIFPYAGENAPSGYLLCDGSEKPIGQYQKLFNIIKYTYTPNTNTLVGASTFKLPDLRGRFPLGLLNMDNGDQVRTPSGTTVDSGGGTPNPSETTRVRDSTATIRGQVSGAEQIKLDITQLPQHQHTLIGDTGSQYYATNPQQNYPNDTGSIRTNTIGSNPGQALPNTGNINTLNDIGQSIGIMNPYLTINYIIYSGVHI
jgi:microcystin-dependent protein